MLSHAYIAPLRSLVGAQGPHLCVESQGNIPSSVVCTANNWAAAALSKITIIMQNYSNILVKSANEHFPGKYLEKLRGKEFTLISVLQQVQFV